jgi:predicted branched-subunit amino acid permease
VVRDALAVGAATGAYGVSFGAIANAAGLSALQAAALSLLMFTGASQFALVGVLAGGGSAVSAAATAALLGSRNAFYGLSLAPRLAVRGVRRLLAAQLIIDESTAMATAQADPRAGRLAFWATGSSVFVLWNLATVVGALGADALADPSVLGLDAAAPAAFLALLAPRLRRRELRVTALVAALAALALTPFVPVGLAVLVAAVPAVALGSRWVEPEVLG